jgi:hypothetical protein
MANTVRIGFAPPFRIGPDLFRAACDMGLEGLVSKRRDRPYQAGRSKYWVKVKNRKHPAMSRVMERRAASGPVYTENSCQYAPATGPKPKR